MQCWGLGREASRGVQACTGVILIDHEVIMIENNKEKDWRCKLMFSQSRKVFASNCLGSASTLCRGSKVDYRKLTEYLDKV
jgi:hypothetical protein